MIYGLNWVRIRLYFCSFLNYNLFKILTFYKELFKSRSISILFGSCAAVLEKMTLSEPHNTNALSSSFHWTLNWFRKVIENVRNGVQCSPQSPFARYRGRLASFHRTLNFEFRKVMEGVRNGVQSIIAIRQISRQTGRETTNWGCEIDAYNHKQHYS